MNRIELPTPEYSLDAIFNMKSITVLMSLLLMFAIHRAASRIIKSQKQQADRIISALKRKDFE